MARRRLGQFSFADGLVKQRSGRNDWFSNLDKIISWSAIEAVLSPIYASDEGRPSYPLLTLFRALLLQQWYGLSDEGLEQALDDRLSFRRFAGVPLDENVPDHSTLWRFRQELARYGLDRALFAEVNRQLAARGLILKHGTLIDATVVQAAVRPPRASEGSVSERDPDAGWTTKRGRSTFGYKAHLAVDEGSGLIRGAEMSGADLHDSQCFQALVQGDEAAVYADKAYASAAHRAQLKEAGIADGLMYRAARNRPLKPWQLAFNKAVAPIRAGVERSFATLKCHYRFRRARYLRLARNACHLKLLCTAVNLRRALVLAA